MQGFKASLSEACSLGRAWAAIRGQRALATISMRVPKDIDFQTYRNHAMATLKLLGEVKSGELMLLGNQLLFVQQLSHPNRGKQDREPNVYLLHLRE